MKNSEPLVSVVIAVYNDKKYFHFSIESILNQTYRNFEVWIVDDCSDEETKKLLESYRNKFPKIVKYLRLDRNLGEGEKARNKVIPFAKGKYIAVFDSDDIAYPDRLEKQVRFLEDNTNVFLVGGQADIIDENGAITGERIQPQDSEQIKKQMYRKNGIINPSIMFRNEHKKEFYLTKFPFFNDYFTFGYLLSQGRIFRNLPDKLIKYRINRNGATFSNIKYKFSVNMEIKNALIKDLGYKPSIFDKLYVSIQNLTIKIVPERILFRIYMLFRNK